MLSGFEDKSGYGQCMIALAFPGEEPILFVGKCPGQIVQARKTDQKETFGWDPIFQPDTDSANNPNTLTFAEMDKLEKNKISHRSMAVAKLNAYLEANMERFQDTKGEKQ
jgi:inosine triphosphate pyrophosphatase